MSDLRDRTDLGVRRIVGAGELWVTEYAINYEGKLFQTVSISEHYGVSE